MLTLSSSLVLRQSICAILGGLVAGHTAAGDPTRIEVFTTATQPVAIGAAALDRSVTVETAEIDAIARFNNALSDGLASTPETARRQGEQRLRKLDVGMFASLQRAATGLALAVQLGVDRTPAIVFDRQAVIYGVTDLAEALERYRAWAATRSP